MHTLTDITRAVLSYHPHARIDLIEQAYHYAEQMHQGQARASGEPYWVHPVEVALLLTQLKLDEAAIATGLLHDTVEDTLSTIEDIELRFGTDVAHMVDGVTKLSKMSFTFKEDRQAENFRKMLVAMSKDIRVILVKLADRCHNMRTLHFMEEHKRERIAQETLDIYAPLSNRLGIHWLKSELEDLSFKYIKPKEYHDLYDHVVVANVERQHFIDEVIRILQHKMQESDIDARVTGRIKHLYSIYKKMKENNLDIDQIYDILAFRVVVDSVSHCYAALGLVHALWRPIPGRFKDYIAMPKPNMYQSLHTTVIGPSGNRVEIQIRTQQMHDIAEEGVAAHWEYKESAPSKATLKRTDASQFAWLRQLMEWQKELSDPTEFIDTVKVDLFSDEVFVFTPKGKVVSLVQGSCPIDFAFAIHSHIGMRCVGARVNGKLVPLKHKLRNGDVVEILTADHQSPSKDWLNFIKTSRAKNKIRAFIRTEERKRSTELGREFLDKELRKSGSTLKKHLESKNFDVLLGHYKCNSSEELFVQIGYGKILALDLVRLLLQQEKPKSEVSKPASKESYEQQPKQDNNKRSSSSGILVQGVDDMLVRFPKCCSPLPGDRIVGFVTRGKGIAVHAYNCSRAIDLDPERRVEVVWDKNAKFKRAVGVRVLSSDKPGILATLSQVFSSMGINISQANCKVIGDNRAINTFEVAVSDIEQIKKIINAMEKVSGVISVERA